jgi:hypothetical protein
MTSAGDMVSPLRVTSRPRCEDVAPDVESFLHALGGPTWIDLPGDSPGGPARLVATLLHGNEPSGVRALHAYLRSSRCPAVDTVFFIASVDAALGPPWFAHRMLAGRRDFNRCFTAPFEGVEGARARAFVDRLAGRSFEAVIDMHNNTGRSPAYGVGHGVDAARLNLTALFGDFFMNSDLALGTLVEWTGRSCPSVTIECGRAGDAAADAVALAGLERFLSVPALRLDAVPPAHLGVFSHPVRVRLASDGTIAISERRDPDADLTLRHDLDTHNFMALAPGTWIGWLGRHDGWPLDARGADGRELSRHVFEVASDGRLYTTTPFVPIMMTSDPVIAKSDCLFYAMNLPNPPVPSAAGS